MYKQTKSNKTDIRVNKSYVGERIEIKVMRILQNKEPITDGSPLYYTERSEGVRPEFNVRTDKFELAAEAMDKVAEQTRAIRDEKMKAVKGGKKDEPGEDSGSNTADEAKG